MIKSFIFLAVCSSALLTTLQLPSLGSRVWAGPTTGFDLSNMVVKLCPFKVLTSRAFAHSYLPSWDLCLLPVDKWLAFWRMRAHNDQSHVCPATPQIRQSPARSANSTCSWPLTRERAQSGHLNCPWRKRSETKWPLFLATTLWDGLLRGITEVTGNWYTTGVEDISVQSFYLAATFSLLLLSNILVV